MTVQNSSISGPKVQVPSWAAQAFPEIPEAQSFLHRIQSIAFNQTRTGPSASRPSSAMEGRWIGMPYYDQNLSTTVYLSSVNPDVWTGRVSMHKSADTNYSTTAMVNDPELTIPVLANDHYVGRTFLDIGPGLRATGVKVAIIAPAGATGTYFAGLMLDAASAGNVDTLRASTPNTTLDFTAGSINTALNGFMEVSFHLINGTTTGNFQFQFAQSTASSTAMTVRTGSQISANKVT